MIINKLKMREIILFCKFIISKIYFSLIKFNYNNVINKSYRKLIKKDLRLLFIQRKLFVKYTILRL